MQSGLSFGVDRHKDQMNARQSKVVARMFAEGTKGFEGGLSAQNYVAITQTSASTVTRDLKDLVDGKCPLPNRRAQGDTLLASHFLRKCPIRRESAFGFLILVCRFRLAGLNHEQTQSRNKEQRCTGLPDG